MKFAKTLLSFFLFSASTDATLRRRLEDQAEEEEDISWMSGYTLRYEQCFQSGGVEYVYFSLCPEGNGCVQGCDGGIQYVSQLNYFVGKFVKIHLGNRYRISVANFILYYYNRCFH